MPMQGTVLGGLDKMTAKFAAWGQSLTGAGAQGHTGFQALLSMFQTETPLAVNALRQLSGIVKTVVADMTGLDGVSNSKTLLQLADPVLTLANALLKTNPDLVRLAMYLLAAHSAATKLAPVFSGITQSLNVIKTGVSGVRTLASGFRDASVAADAASGTWGTLGGKLSVMVTAIKGWGIWSGIASAATKVWTGIQAAFDVVMSANPIMLVVIAIAALVAGVIYAYTHFQTFRDIVKTAMHDITAAVSAVVSWVTGHWPLLLAILTGPIGLATLFIVDHWKQIVSGASSMLNSVVSFFTGLPGKIIGALSSLASMLFNAGVHAMESLISGIESMIGSLGSTMGNIASKIAGFIGLSPAKEGPLSGGGAPEIRGQHIAADIARGMTSGTAAVASAATRIAGSAAGISGGAGGTAAAGAGGGVMKVQLEFATGGSDQSIVTALGRAIRVRGGNVQTVLGHG